MKKRISKLIRVIRKSWYTWKVARKCKRVGTGLAVNGKTSIHVELFLGNNVNFNGMNIAGPGMVTIGNNFHSGIECMMITQVHNYDCGNAIPYDNTYITKPIIIEDNVWLGNRVMVLAGVTIGEGAIIQAGSVVVSDIPRFAIAGGHPAKVFKYRDINHYEKLKNEGKFH